MNEIKCKNIKKTIAYHWLSKTHNGRGVKLNARARVFKKTYISKIEKGYFPVLDIKSACNRVDQTSLLESYIASKESGDNFIIEDQFYYNKLRFFEDGRDKRSEAVSKKRITTFIELYESMKIDGWIEGFDSNPSDLRKLPAISILNLPTLEVQKIGLPQELREKVKSNQSLPFRVIDGHHRLACAIVLGMKTIPTIIYTLSLKSLKESSK